MTQPPPPPPQSQATIQPPNEELTLKSSVHPAYRHQLLVPSWAVPTGISLVISLLGLVAGAVLGSGLGTLQRDDDPEMTKQIAEACLGARPNLCSKLSLEDSSNIPLLLLGLALTLMYGFATWFTRPKNESDAN